MSDYTKGPWTAKDNGIYGADGYSIAYPIRQAITKLGSDEYSHQWIERNQEANTSLIAAAPELLESLVSMLEVHGVTQVYADKHIEIPQSWVEVSDKARAAIAKAKGEAK